MKQKIFDLELLTPCFCAGANQAVAEIRAPAIRGQLRWWFRSLGGNAEDERIVFGGVAGDAAASTLIVRVSLIKKGDTWSPPRIDPNSPESYVWYYASVSGKAPGSGSSNLGPRWTNQGATPPYTTFCLQLLQKRPLSEALQVQLDRAVKCFLQLGSIGLRATRGLGAFHCIQTPFDPAILTEITKQGFKCELRTDKLSSTEQIASEVGGLLKGTRKAQNMNAKGPSPFGSSSPRQTSAIYFRPVRPTSSDKTCQLVVFEAPHNRVLGPKSARNTHVVGQPISQLVKSEFSPRTRRW